MSRVYSQQSTDQEIQDWTRNIIECERGVILSDAEVFSLLDDGGLIHLARVHGEGDTEVGDQILEAYDDKLNDGGREWLIADRKMGDPKP